MCVDRIRRLRLGIIGYMLLVPAGVAFATDSLAQIMTAEDYEAAGLDRLSPEQREHLRQWIERYRGGAAEDGSRALAPERVPASPVDARTPTAQATPAPPARSRAEERAVAPDTIHSRIVGEFSGWTGDTIFELENGEVWQQRQPGRLSFHAVDPEVVLRRNRLGFYSMEIPAAGRAVLVRRLR